MFLLLISKKLNIFYLQTEESVDLLHFHITEFFEACGIILKLSSEILLLHHNSAHIIHDTLYGSIAGWVLSHVVYGLLLFPSRYVRPLLPSLQELLSVLDKTNQVISSVTSFTDHEDLVAGMYITKFDIGYITNFLHYRS